MFKMEIQTEEKDLFIKYLSDTLKATILQKRLCPNFETFYEDPKEKYPRCLLDEYSVPSGQRLSHREARKICPFFDPKTIETKCTFYLNYYETEEEQENEVIEDGQLKYIKGVGSFLKVKLEPELKLIEEDKEKKYEYRHLKTIAKRVIQMQIDTLRKHLGIPPKPTSRYRTKEENEREDEDSFRKWKERTIKKITEQAKT